MRARPRFSRLPSSPKSWAMARVSSTAWSGRTKTSMSDAIRSPSERPPPASTLKPTVPSTSRAGHRPMSSISTRAQSSRQPVTAILNFRGRLAYSRLPVKKAEIAWATGRASTTSSASTPETGHEQTLRAESPQAWTVVRPTSQNRCQIRGMSSMRSQWSWIVWRVVMSAYRLPKIGLSSGPSPNASAATPISRTCGAVSTPPGTLIRIMNASPPWRWGYRPTHFSRSTSPGTAARAATPSFEYLSTMAWATSNGWRCSFNCSLSFSSPTWRYGLTNRIARSRPRNWMPYGLSRSRGIATTRAARTRSCRSPTTARPAGPRRRPPAGSSARSRSTGSPSTRADGPAGRGRRGSWRRRRRST